MLAMIRDAVLHASDDAPAQRDASVARSPISESGTFPITTRREVESGEIPTRPGVDPYAEQASRILNDALASVGATPADLARALGVHPSLARSYCQPEQQRSLGLPKILRLCRSAPSIHGELVRRIVGACGARAPASQDPGRDMALAVGACGEFASTIAKILAFGVTPERIPEGRRAVAMARQTLDAVERALEDAAKGSR